MKEFSIEELERFGLSKEEAEAVYNHDKDFFNKKVKNTKDSEDETLDPPRIELGEADLLPVIKFLAKHLAELEEKYGKFNLRDVDQYIGKTVLSFIGSMTFGDKRDGKKVDEEENNNIKNKLSIEIGMKIIGFDYNKND